MLTGLAHQRVNSIAPDGAGGLWVAADGALYQGRQGSFRAYTTADGLPGNLFKSVIRSRNGDVWATAPPEGVARLHAGRWIRYTCGREISAVDPRAVYEDAEGAIWVTTEGGGINRFKNERWRTFTVHDGLANDFISGITEDGSGSFWISCPGGIMRIGREQFDELDAGQRAALLPRMVNRSDGLPAAEFNHVGSPSAWRARDGRLLFPTDSGVAVIQPERLRINRLAPAMHIERFVAGGRDAELPGPPVVPPGDNDIQIHYTAISLSAAENVRFKIRLEPLDATWVDTGGRRDVRYAKLPPGRYTFRVIACNSDGVWNTTGAALAFVVRPAFYQTTWFAGLVALIVGGGGFGVYWARSRRARRLMQELEGLVSARTRELQAAKDAAEAAVLAKNEVIAALEQARIEREALNRQLIEASRKAGKAEVATSVLHNVGNVLNSVNISASLLVERIRKSKAPNVGRVAALLREHAAALGEFLARNPKGQRLPAFLEVLGKQLEAEQSRALSELDGLCRNIDHIKDIVSMQQSNAKVLGVIEKVKPLELVEEALRMSEGAGGTKEFRVARNYDPDLPELMTDRHKALQILLNLISNSKQACRDSQATEPRLILGVANLGDRIRISVGDNGVGIPPENLTLIFSHGFTTRKDGHGFGLHSGALAARELGGALTVQSDGPGKGATFTLELPLRSPEPRAQGAKPGPLSSPAEEGIGSKSEARKPNQL